MEASTTPFATLHTTTAFPHARAMKTLAAASINGLTLAIPPDFAFGTTNTTPAFLAKFPHGKIPALETASGFLLSESSAIAHYVCDSGPARDQLLGRSAEERALVQMWASLADEEILANAAPLVGAATGRQRYIPEIQEVKEMQFLRAMRRLEVHLENAGRGRTWLVREDELSLADLSVASSLYWPLKFILDGEARGRFPRVMGWWERLMAVEEVGKAFGAPLAFCEKRPEVLGEAKK
ncbi:glutathione S-transferase [Melanomma pulvis-pyrius CBS 109.77]|uniref:Glutathione S-transferase n=1 Tax=Melanomma pulvis-pyrius CBS 109.77 TaxID=1314802 RepID=A0A6A6XTY0_9PLEO|nr:glutathione S-transferase [Melanomma pulvis-pyrius CBS 109.77]